MKRVGWGGFADVYLAEKLGTGESVALKRFRTLEVCHCSFVDDVSNALSQAL
jgi:hypothetical protein